MRGSWLAAMGVALVAVGIVGEARGQLMVCDSAGDRVMLLSAEDGSVIDADWITDQGAVGWAFSTPKEARVIGGEIWVSDQVEDAIRRFDMTDRHYLGSITAHFNAGVLLDNIRGFGTDGTHVYVACFGDAANRGIVQYDLNGTPTAFYPGSGSYFDAEPFMGDLLVPSTSSNDVERWVGGVYAGAFASGVTFPQQVTVLTDDSVIVVSSIAPAGVEGVYHFNADGSLRRYISTEGAKGLFGELVPRGAVVLGDGDYLVTTDIGVFKTVGTPPTSFVEIVGGVNAQYVVAMPAEPPPACACDWNEDAVLNSQDFFDFLTSFFDGAADFNEDLVTNSQDFFDFLGCFFGGC
jgi:hypothetical protein